MESKIAVVHIATKNHLPQSGFLISELEHGTINSPPFNNATGACLDCFRLTQTRVNKPMQKLARAPIPIDSAVGA